MEQRHIDPCSAGIIAETAAIFSERAREATSPEEKLYNEFMAAISEPFGKTLYSSVIVHALRREVVWDAIVSVAGALVAEAIVNLAPDPDGVDFREIGESVAAVVRFNVAQRKETTVGRVEMPRA